MLKLTAIETFEIKDQYPHKHFFLFLTCDNISKKERNENSFLIGHAQACMPKCALQNEP